MKEKIAIIKGIIKVEVKLQDFVGGLAYQDKVLARYHDCFLKCWSGVSVCCQQTTGSNPRSHHLQPLLLPSAAR